MAMRAILAGAGRIIVRAGFRAAESAGELRSGGLIARPAVPSPQPLLPLLPKWPAAGKPSIYTTLSSGQAVVAGIKPLNNLVTCAPPARLFSTSKIPAPGSRHLRYLLAICAAGGGISTAWFCLSDLDKNMEDFHDGVLPDSVDWTLLPGFPDVADPCYNANDYCGSCWAVVAVKSVEAFFAIEFSGMAQKLSIQQVIDCADIEGCSGSDLDVAFKYIHGAGLTTEEAYPGPPARGRTFWFGLLCGYCKMAGKPVVAKIEGYERVDPGEESLMLALQTGPVAVYVNINDLFQQYKGRGRVLDSYQCPPRSVAPATKHVVLVVGYGKDRSGRRYWKIMNTWGPEWGDAGYGRFLMGVGHPGGVAGMMEHPGFRPIVGKTSLVRVIPRTAPARSLHSSLRDLASGGAAGVAAAALAGGGALAYFKKAYDESAARKKEEDVKAMFEDWMKKHNRTYRDDDEKAMRFQMFKDTLKLVESQPPSDQEMFLPLNFFSDFTREERNRSCIIDSGEAFVSKPAMKQGDKQATQVSA